MHIKSKLKRIIIFKKLYKIFKNFEFLFYYNKLLNHPTWDLLWKYSTIAKFHNNHKYYERVLTKYDNIDFSKILTSDYIGDGAGSNSLNTYRKVQIRLDRGNYICFEKVYRADSPQFLRTEWFYNTIFPLINNQVKIPKLYLVNGNKVKVAYFEWIESESNNSLGSEDIVKFYFKYLYNVFLNLRCRYIDSFSDFSSDESYRINICNTKRWIRFHIGCQQAELLERVESLLKDCSKFKRIFTHGDIGPSNIINNRFLIDYDSFGFYPIGFEFAVILCKSYKVSSIEEIEEQFVRYDNLANDVSPKLPFWFFTFVFYTGGRAILIKKSLIKQIYIRLVEESKLYNL